MSNRLFNFWKVKSPPDTWLDKLCNPLEHPKYPQIRGTLAKYKNYSNVIIGKCATGEIACQNGIKYSRGQRLLYRDDYIRLGIPEDFIYSGLPNLTSCDGFDFEYQISKINDYIITLNDSGFKYPQITEFLRTTFEGAV